LQAGNEITAKGAKIAKSGPVIPTEVEESLSYWSVETGTWQLAADGRVNLQSAVPADDRLRNPNRRVPVTPGEVSL